MANFVSRRRIDPDVTVKSPANNTLNMIQCNWLKSPISDLMVT